MKYLVRIYRERKAANDELAWEYYRTIVRKLQKN